MTTDNYQQKMNEKHDFTQGPIAKKMMGFAMPVFFAMLMQSLYGVVDIMIVGWFGTKADVAAVSTGAWIIWTVFSLTLGLASGITTLVGQKIGEKNYNAAVITIASSARFFLCLSIITAVLMEFLAVPCAKLMQTPPQAFENTVLYTRICSAGLVCAVAYVVLGAIFRGLGDSKTPLIAVTIATLTNIAGDLLLVGYFKIPVAGAAYATIFGQAVSVAVTLYIVSRRKRTFEYDKSALKYNKNSVISMLRIGVPMALQDFLVTVSFLAITAIVNNLGVTFSAAAGIAERICGLIMLVPMTFAQTVASFTAQNAGAGTDNRATAALRYGITASLTLGAFFAWLSFFHGDLLASAFANGKSDVIFAAADYLKAYAIDCFFVSFMFCFEGYFAGYGRTRFIMWQGIIGAFCVRIPVSYFMSKIEPVSLFKIALATPASTLLQLILFSCYFVYFNRKREKDLS